LLGLSGPSQEILKVFTLSGVGKILICDNREKSASECRGLFSSCSSNLPTIGEHCLYIARKLNPNCEIEYRDNYSPNILESVSLVIICSTFTRNLVSSISEECSKRAIQACFYQASSSSAFALCCKQTTLAQIRDSSILFLSQYSLTIHKHLLLLCFSCSDEDFSAFKKDFDQKHLFVQKDTSLVQINNKIDISFTKEKITKRSPILDSLLGSILSYTLLPFLFDEPLIFNFFNFDLEDRQSFYSSNLLLNPL